MRALTTYVFVAAKPAIQIKLQDTFVWQVEMLPVPIECCLITLLPRFDALNRCPALMRRTDQLRCFRESRISVSKSTSAVGPAGAAGSTGSVRLILLIMRTIWKMMKAKIKKLREIVRKLP